jgi:hypothetical protein
MRTSTEELSPENLEWLGTVNGEKSLIGDRKRTPLERDISKLAGMMG